MLSVGGMEEEEEEEEEEAVAALEQASVYEYFPTVMKWARQTCRKLCHMAGSLKEIYFVINSKIAIVLTIKHLPNACGVRNALFGRL